ncbi:hypothetical protein HOY82DRAFT_371837 [Tuber indicum]|nr:hypothetical protein HOY82DRAFT_371837 [Tuber indicum]
MTCRTKTYGFPLLLLSFFVLLGEVCHWKCERKNNAMGKGKKKKKKNNYLRQKWPDLNLTSCEQERERRRESSRRVASSSLLFLPLSLLLPFLPFPYFFTFQCKKKKSAVR